MKSPLIHTFKTIMSVVFLATPLAAQEVTLKSVDGGITLTGELIDFDGSNYIIRSTVGEMSISAGIVECIGDACPDLVAGLEAFSIIGSDLMGEAFLPTMIEAFALERGGDLQIEFGGNGAAQYYVIDADGSVYSTITVNSGSYRDSFAALVSGEAAIGFFRQAPSGAIIDEFARKGLGDLTSADQEKIIALNGVTIVVHPDNPIKSLSMAEIVRVYAGEVDNWSQLGGLNAPISLYRLDANAGSTAFFAQKAVEVGGVSYASAATVLQSDAQIAGAVSRDPNGIGISAIFDAAVASILPLRSVCDQVVAPSRFALKSEEYPLTQRLYMYTTSAARSDRANEFMAFVLSETGQMVAENAGYIGQNVMRLSLDQQGLRIANAVVAENSITSLGNLQNLLTTVLEAERLSLTFRFINGSFDLDNRAKGDISRLADMIRAGAFEDKQILVLGFTDDIGSEPEKARFSQARAELVRDAIITATGASNLGNVKITPVGYGNTSPLACNETYTGQYINRRVEIWVR